MAESMKEVTVTQFPPQATSDADSSRTPSRLAEDGATVQHERDSNRSATAPVLTGAKLYAIIGALALVTLVFSLDTLIIATAIPKITDEFDTVVDIGWYATAYFLGNCALQPLTGKIYTYFNLTYSYLAFVLIFSIGSIVCAAAPNSDSLIIGRAVAGIGSSGMMNGAMTIIAVAAEPERRPALMGLLMAIMGLGQIVSPLIGGALSEHASWRWCFWINLPCGALVAVAFLFLQVPNPNRKTGLTLKTFFKKFDITGFAIFAPACVMILLALQWGGNEYDWNSATVIGLFCGAAVAFGLLILWEARQGDDAMFPGSLIRQRVVYSSCITSALVAGSMFLIVYYLSLWFQAIKRSSPTVSALSTLPTFVLQILAVIVSSILISKIGFFTPFAISGAALSSLGAGLMSTFNPATSLVHWVGFQILTGVGRGLAFQQPVNAIQASLSGPQMPTGMAIVAWAQFFGGAIFLGVGQTSFTNILRNSIRQFVPSIDPESVIQAGATDYYHLAPDDVTQLALLTAYNQAIVRTFYLAAAAGALGTITSIGMGWKRVLKPKSMASPSKDPEK